MRRLFDFWPWGLLPLPVTVVLIMGFSTIVDLKINKAQADLQSLETALGVYKSRHGDFPTDSEGLAALIGKDDLLERLSKDPWGNSYLYHHKAGTDAYLVYSPGVNHRDEQGQGDDVISGAKEYRCVDYGVNCPPTPAQTGAWAALALAVLSAGVGLARLVLRLRKLTWI